ncbi:YheC/YheD family protein [Alteribacter aurantiacus]|uniref:YheC/YheD family protein n=1 Tax=Alteribacter aurantiacus TaxID=254410 RepID=UPI0004011B45|nr:YheC/YheD family protein [Alteribacter aurantiacus]
MIYYDPFYETWLGDEDTTQYSFGGKDLSFVEPSQRAIPFSVALCEKTKAVGPFVIVLTESHTIKPFTGDERLYLSIHRSLSRIGGVLMIVTASSLEDIHRTLGYIYNENNREWIQAHGGKPDVVYNRVPFRRLERKETFAQIKRALTNAHTSIFNPRFLTKKDLLELSIVNLNLPKTEELTSFSQFKQFVSVHRNVLIKDSNGSKGQGIYRLVQRHDDSCILTTQKGSTPPLSLEAIWGLLVPVLSKRTLLIQEQVKLTTWNGSPYDYRVLLHRVKGQWECSGVGIRVAGSEAFTTHTLYGGHLLDPLKVGLDTKDVTSLAKETASLLPDTFYELSMDIGSDEHNRLYVFDINSKPMIFDEAHIREKGAQHVALICHELGGFSV